MNHVLKIILVYYHFFKPCESKNITLKFRMNIKQIIYRLNLL